MRALVLYEIMWHDIYKARTSHTTPFHPTAVENDTTTILKANYIDISQTPLLFYITYVPIYFYPELLYFGLLPSE